MKSKTDCQEPCKYLLTRISSLQYGNQKQSVLKIT